MGQPAQSHLLRGTYRHVDRGVGAERDDDQSSVTLQREDQT